MKSEAGRVPIEAIRSLIEDALTVAGLPREDAAKCAKLMGEADLTGADAHGVFRLRAPAEGPRLQSTPEYHRDA